MSEFDSELYVRVAFFAFLIRLGSGEFSIICNLSIRVATSVLLISYIYSHNDNLSTKIQLALLVLYCNNQKSNIRDPRSYEHYWTSSWNKTWKN